MTLSDDKLQDYIDGRLSSRESAVVAAKLMAHPDRMREVARLELLNRMLRSVGLQILEEPVPDRLTQALKNARKKAQR